MMALTSRAEFFSFDGMLHDGTHGSRGFFSFDDMLHDSTHESGVLLVLSAER